MDYIIVDDMKKESVSFRNVMIIGYFLSVSHILVGLLFEYSDNYPRFDTKDIFLLSFAYLLVGSWGLYCWLYALNYKLIISNEKIKIITLFYQKEFAIQSISKYTYKRYLKSSFYQFKLYIGNNKIFISTKCPDEIILILELNKS